MVRTYCNAFMFKSCILFRKLFSQKVLSNFIGKTNKYIFYQNLQNTILAQRDLTYGCQREHITFFL
jgi:hypothetical protein